MLCRIHRSSVKRSDAIVTKHMGGDVDVNGCVQIHATFESGMMFFLINGDCIIF